MPERATSWSARWTSPPCYDRLAPLIQSSIPRKVGLVLNLAPGLPGIEADKTQLEQVAMNLIINAAEAIEGEGTVTVTTGIRRVDASEQRHFLTDQQLDGCYVALEVRDTGTGMDEETRRRIFDPFFSTKFLGRGLGLSATWELCAGITAPFG